MKSRSRVSRSIKSWMCANIILDNGLFDEFKVFCYRHPKLKSKYRAANLFLIHKRLRYKAVVNPLPVNMDILEEYYYGE